MAGCFGSKFLPHTHTNAHTSVDDDIADAFVVLFKMCLFRLTMAKLSRYLCVCVCVGGRAGQHIDEYLWGRYALDGIEFVLSTLFCVLCVRACVRADCSSSIWAFFCVRAKSAKNIYRDSDWCGYFRNNFYTRRSHILCLYVYIQSKGYYILTVN